MAQMAKANRSDEIKTPLFIASYPNCIDPVPSMNDESILEYQLTALFPKATTNMDVLKGAIAALAKKAFGDATDMSFLQLPIADGDKPNTKGIVVDANRGHWVMRMKSKYAPSIYGSDGKTVLRNQEELRPGNLMRAIVQFYTYDNKKRGVGATLLAAFKQGDGEPLIGQGAKDYSDRFAEDAIAVGGDLF